MKTLALTLFVCGCFLAVSGQNLFIDTAKQNIINDSFGYLYSQVGTTNLLQGHFQWFVKESDSVCEGYLEKTSDLQVFRLDTILLNDFANFKETYKRGIDSNSSKIIRNDTGFVINFEKTERVFTSHRMYYSIFESYLGFLESLNLYITNGINGTGEVSWMELIDKKTGKSYHFVSNFDNAIADLLISPKQSYLLGYANDLYDDNSFISILKINKTKKAYTLNDFYGINMDGTCIKELVWIDENSFAIAANETYTYETVAPKYYLRISFK